MSESIVDVLVARDGVTRQEAEELLEEMREEVRNGADPEEVLAEFADLEPDYIWELL